MTKIIRKPVTMLLALCMVFTLAVGACADDITSSGGSATSPLPWNALRYIFYHHNH